MESDPQQQHFQQQQRHNFHDHHQRQMNSGMTRYQSAPSSYFSSFLDRDFCIRDEFLNRPTSPETERIFEQFLKSTTESAKQSMIKMEEEEAPTPAAKADKQSSCSSIPSQGFYQHQLQNQNPGSDPGPGTGYGAAGTTGMDTKPPLPPMDGGGNSNLIRHRSSPAGFFDTINIENGYFVMRGMGAYGGDVNNNTNRETSFNSKSKVAPCPSRLINQTSFSDSWDDSASSKGLTSERRTHSGGLKMPEIKNAEAANRSLPLAHHLSLPTSLSEISEIEKLLQSSDSVPCKIRAKRGCATHPRSIAERVRRTKISERMKKLQDLVPNMDKQTNTADMLDLAVDYIKDLQKQVKNLSEDRENCSCSIKQ